MIERGRSRNLCDGYKGASDTDTVAGRDSPESGDYDKLIWSSLSGLETAIAMMIVCTSEEGRSRSIFLHG